MKYEEVRLDGRRSFELLGGKLKVSGKDTLGNFQEDTIDLSLVLPDPDRRVVRYRYWQYGLWLAVIGSGGIAFMDSNKMNVSGYWYWLFGFTGIFGIILFVLSYCRQVEFLIFRNTNGTPILTIAKPKKPTEEFDKFLGAILQAIQSLRSIKP